MAEARRRGLSGGRGLGVRLAGAVVVAGLVAAVVGTSLALSGDDTPETTTTEPPDLSGPAEELAELLELRQGQTYHARYEGRSGDSTIVIETWQVEEAQVRQDQILTAGEQGAHLASIDTTDGHTRCTRTGEAEWACRRATPSEIDQGDPLAAIRERLATSEVSATDARIDGDPARCFALEGGAERSELCVRPATGIPVRITGGSTELRLLLFEETVDPAVFEPPGPVPG